MNTFKVSKITGANKVCEMLWSQAMVNRKQYHYTMIYLEWFLKKPLYLKTILSRGEYLIESIDISAFVYPIL